MLLQLFYQAAGSANFCTLRIIVHIYFYAHNQRHGGEDFLYCAIRTRISIINRNVNISVIVFWSVELSEFICYTFNYCKAITNTRHVSVEVFAMVWLKTCSSGIGCQVTG